MFVNKHKPLIIAHRGASAHAPENTLAAFRRAIDDGADGLEFDVRIAKDGVPVVFHDSTLKRMARGKEGRTSSFTTGELQTLDLGAWFNGRNPKKADDKFAGETVPTLEKLFSFLGGYGGRLYLELKGSPLEISALAESVARIVKQRIEFLPQIICKSFKLEAVEKIKKLLPEVCTGALFAPKPATLLQKHSRLIERAREARADELSLHYSLATEKLVRTAGERGMPTTIWTADHPIWVRRAMEIGIHAIITNNPARLLVKRREILQENTVLG